MMDKLREAVGQISNDAKPFTSSKALGPTASLDASPCSTGARHCSSGYLYITVPNQLTGPPPISLPIVSRRKKEISKAANAAQQRSRSASVASNNSDTSNGSSSSGSSTTSARAAIDKSYQESSAFAVDNLAHILLIPIWIA